MNRSQIEHDYDISITKLINIKDVYKIHTEQHGILCLKGYNTSSEDMNFISRVFNHLQNKDYPYSPFIYPTRSNASWIRKHDTYYMLTNWVDGDTPNFKNKRYIQKAVKALAKFHRHAEGLPQDSIPPSRHTMYKLPEKAMYYKQLLEASLSEDIAKPLVDMCDQASYYLQDEVSAAALQQESAAGAFTHGDYNFPNLIKYNHHIYLIDFENCHHLTRMTDLSHILHRNFAWHGNTTLRFIQYYERYRPLPHEHRHLLAALLLIPYPVVRDLQIRRKTALPLPSTEQIDKYIRYIKRLL
jgi:CotS family spore coat protein